jgi:hypothetical protein
MVKFLVLVEREAAPGKRRPLPAPAALVNATPPQLENCVGISTLSAKEELARVEGARTMRAVIFVIIIAVLVLLAAIATGFLHVNQVRPGRVPQVSTTHNGVTAKGGRAPAFEVETGSVRVGTRPATVKVPDIRVQPAAGAPANDAAATTGNHD